MTPSATPALRDFLNLSSIDASKSITINSKDRERSGSDLSASWTSTESSIFDTVHMSETASISSSATSDNEDHDVDQKHHPPRIASKTFISQQTTQTIEEDPEEDSEDGARISAGPVHPGIHVTKAADTTSRPITPPSLRGNTDLENEQPVEMRPYHKGPVDIKPPLPNGNLPTEKSPGTATGVSAPSTTPVGTPLTSAKKEKGFFHLPKLHRSKSQALLPADSNAHVSLKTSIKGIFSHNNSANSTISAPPTPPSSQHSSVPGTPGLAAAKPEHQRSQEKVKSAGTPAQGPRRVASVGPNMMLNKHTPANVPTTVVQPATMTHEETHVADVGFGHKAINGRISRATSEPPEPAGLVRAKTLKECGITNRGKHAGKGATSTVTRCQSNGKLLALKAFKKPNRGESDNDFKRRVNIEYEIAHSLHHPNVVETMELIWDEGKHNWAETMEWCGGGDLFSIIKAGYMTTIEKNCCFKQLVRGVAYMHSMGIAHRDIKPENLLLNEDGQLKITDFGVSDVVVQSGGVCRKCHGMCGSEPYMAPEVHTHNEYDGFPLDIWSCGVVCLCLAFGGILWTKAIEGNPGYDKFIAEIRKFEALQARREARLAAVEAAARETKSETDKAIEEDSQSIVSDKPNGVDHLDAGKSDVDKLSLKSTSDDDISRISSALSLHTGSAPSSPPNGLVTPGGTPDLSRHNSFPSTLVEGYVVSSTPHRSRSFKPGPSVKPTGMIQSPRPIFEAPGAVKGEVHHPAPRYPPFELFPPLQKRLVYRLLDPNPTTRINAAEILKDPWFKEIGCCSFDPDELFRVQSGFFDASKAYGGRGKGMPVKQNHPNHLINGKAKKPS